MKKFDYILVCLISLILMVFLLVFTGKNKVLSSSPVEAVKDVYFNVSIRGVTLTGNADIFKESENTFLTIRNVPYKKLKIVAVEKFKKKKMMPSSKGQDKFILVDDLALNNQFDYIITLKEEAKITDDGPVVGGNKIKIGIPVILEGFNYKVSGSVSNVQISEGEK